jgi:hypothetical protein
VDTTVPTTQRRYKMIKRLVLFTLCLSLVGGGISWGAGELQVPGAAPATANERAIMEA